MQRGYKLIMLGDMGVGKSSLLIRYVDRVFNAEATHIMINYKIKLIDLDEPIKLYIWDTAGQERFRTITSSYYRDAKGLVLVFDLGDRQTFERLGTWQQDIERYADNHIVLVIGNKCDQPCAVGREEAEAWAAERGYLYLETSAKVGNNVDYAFRWLAQEVHRKRLARDEEIGLKSQRRRCEI